MKVWLVHNVRQVRGGAVAFSYGFEDSPDAEILAPAFNTSKECGAAAVSRHGNFLQWGFSASPSQLTDAGRAFLLNSICYIHEFDGVAPLVYLVSSHRMNTIWLGAQIKKNTDATSFSNVFDADLMMRFQDDPKGLVQYFKKDYELIYRDNGFKVDQELKALGIPSNRRLSTLDRLVTLLKDEKQAPLARKLLARYTDQKFEKAEGWEGWLAANRARIYFTDTGGYKFLVAPADYPVVPGRVGVEAPPDETYQRVYEN